MTALIATLLVGRVLTFGLGAEGAVGRVLTFGPAAQVESGIPHPPLDTLEPAVAEQLRRARQQLDTAISTPDIRSGDLAEAYGTLARLYQVYEFFDAAEAAYGSAIRLAPKDVRWLHLLGYLYQQTGRLEEAADRFVAARRASPNNQAAVVRLGEVYLGLNRLREAREQFQSVESIFPALARQGLGEVALREGRFREAIADFQAALDRVPDATSIHYLLAMAYRGLGRLDDARSHLEKRGSGDIRIGDPIIDGLQALVTGERGLVIQGQRAYEAGQLQIAADAFEKAIHAVPASAAARAGLREVASAWLRRGREEDAIELLRRGRSAAPDDEDTLIGLSILLASKERYLEAVTMLDEDNRTFPDRPATMTTLARLLASSPDRSLRDGRKALDLAMAVYKADPAPAHAETVAMALAELGRCNEALDWIRRAIMGAELAGDAEETARLKRETPRYEGSTCARL
jgi:tetratricopeptide (TPR) repeat protein